MTGVKLKRLYAKNYGPFAEVMNFTTEIDTSKKDSENNIFSIGDSSYNKVSFIYGANGAGKTFFCKTLLEINKILDYSAFMTWGMMSLPGIKGIIDAPIPKFAFDTNYEEKPSEFGLDLLLDGTLYGYNFSLQNGKVISEVLTRKNKRTEKIIERTSSDYKDIILRSELKSFERTKNVVKEEALCLVIASLLNNEFASKIINAIKSISVVNMATARLTPQEPERAFSDERIKKYISVLKKADPTLTDMDISFDDEEVGRQKIETADFENRELIAKTTTVTIKTTHTVYDGKDAKEKNTLEFFKDESLGTIKLFSALPDLYDALETGGVLIIDEVENGLHLSLVKEIIRLFNNERTNPLNAQLICTTHQPLLLDGDFRRDQVWVFSKDKNGKSSINRLSKLKTSRAKVNIVSKILQGAFGCNPDIFFSN